MTAATPLLRAAAALVASLAIACALASGIARADADAGTDDAGTADTDGGADQDAGDEDAGDQDAGDQANGSGGNPPTPVACDGGLCDSTNSSTCSVGAPGAAPCADLVFALGLSISLAAGARRQTRKEER